MKRKIISPKVLANENMDITRFLLARAGLSPDTKLPLQVVFDAYQKWRHKNKLTPTELNIDGFGRLFPKSYPRRSAYWGPVKHALQCVFNLNLKKH